VLRDRSLYQIWAKSSDHGWIIEIFTNCCTRYVTLWPWPLTSWPWALQNVCCHAFKLCTKFEQKSNNPRLSYRRFSAFSRSILGGVSELTELFQWCVGPNFTKLGQVVLQQFWIKFTNCFNMIIRIGAALWLFCGCN